MWNLSVPWWELVIRAVIIYVFLIVILRLTGKRQIGQLAPFDLVLLLVLSNAVQNAMNGGDNSVLAGIISASTLIALNYATGVLTYKNKRAGDLIEGRPELLVHNGVLYRDILEKQQLTLHDLNSALRAAGCAGVEDVHFAFLETNGHITVQPRRQ